MRPPLLRQNPRVLNFSDYLDKETRSTRRSSTVCTLPRADGFAVSRIPSTKHVPTIPSRPAVPCHHCLHAKRVVGLLVPAAAVALRVELEPVRPVRSVFIKLRERTLRRPTAATVARTGVGQQTEQNRQPTGEHLYA